LNAEDDKGWSRHQHFGLRKEWFDSYMADTDGWRQRTSLGNRQVDSMVIWLRTCGIEDKCGRRTVLAEQFFLQGTDDLSLWELLWLNVVFNFPTANWYVRQGLGAWNATELKVLLREAVPRISEWTASNAIMELVGLLERTPVGAQLGQGRVTPDRPRGVTRTGHLPADITILENIRKILAMQKDIRELKYTEDCLWPWIVFGCDRDLILSRLVVMDQDMVLASPEYLTIINHSGE